MLGPGFSSAPATPPETSLTGTTQTLLALIDREDKTRIDPADYEATSLRQLLMLGTPEGYRLKLRYLEFGISMVEALRIARDPELKKRLIEHVQWARRPKVRAEAILALASFSDPAHKRYFKEAILDSKVGIRFAAVEALQIWGQPEAMDLLKMTAGRDWSPLMQVMAAQALLSLGDNSSLPVLYRGLDDNSWVVRAMAARYLGDYGKPDDYQLLTSVLRKEQKNDFVIAELAISALKLISKKGEKVSYSPMSAGWRENEEVAYRMGRDNVVELEPLIIVPPRLRIPASLRLAAEINTQLLGLIRDRLSAKLDPIQAQDPILQELNSMETPSGFALKMRYSELSYLVTEGLAGTSDLILRAELEKLAGEATNPLVRATALIALAYNRNENDIGLIQNALNHTNAIVRFGAMEAIEIGRFRGAIPALSTIATTDPSSALRVYAMQALARFGDPAGRSMLTTYVADLDWPARAMAVWYLGRFGAPEDYYMMLARLPMETNPWVQVELVLGILRLTPVAE